MAVAPQPTASTYLQLEALVKATAAKDVSAATDILREAVDGDVEGDGLLQLLTAAISALASVVASTVPCPFDGDGHQLVAADVMAQLTDESLRRLFAAAPD